MEAMRARTESSCLIPIEIEETGTINSEVFSSWTNHTIWLRNFQGKLRVIGSTNNKSIINSSCVVSMVISETELNTSKLVVSYLEVVETNITYFLSDCTISTILPTCKVIEVSCVSGILPEWISLIIGFVINVIDDILAWVLSWDHVMEDTKTISTAGVSSVISELTNSFILWAHVGVSMWSNCMNLKIIPVTISI
jgi:hypothetical protein